MIREPSTLLTDYALAVLTAWLAWRLRSVGDATRQQAVHLWMLAFAVTAWGSFTGGTYHGFGAMLPPPVAPVLWRATTISIGLSGCLLLAAVFHSLFSARVRRGLLWGLWLELGAYVVWMLFHDAFRYVIFEYGSAMMIVLLLQLVRPKAGSRWIILGIVVSLAAAVVQRSGIDLHRYLNHNDLMHIVQMAGVGLLYKGGATLTDAP
jgi:hypothetical protein